jgi:hypothetical protein
MSLMDALFSIKMDELLESIHVPEEVSEALLHRAGTFGDVLMLIELIEMARGGASSRNTSRLLVEVGQPLPAPASCGFPLAAVMVRIDSVGSSDRSPRRSACRAGSRPPALRAWRVAVGRLDQQLGLLFAARTLLPVP